MQFILKISGNRFNPGSLNVQINEMADSLDTKENVLSIEYQSAVSFCRFENDIYNVFILGDLIIPKNISRQLFFNSLFDSFSHESIRSLKGHFYLLVIDKTKQSIMCFNSLFSILPIYVYEAFNCVMVSSSVKMIKKHAKKDFTMDKKFVVERLLFNYSFLNDTIYQEVKFLPSNHFIKFSDKMELIKHTRIEDYFTDNPVRWENAIDPISELFLNKLEHYFPVEHFYMTLTGGFDGRTLVAAALKNKMDFRTFSYGSRNDKDIQVPVSITRSLNINHVAFVLGEEYARQSYLENLEKLISITDCNSSLSRSHYAFIANKLSASTSYFLSGNFGSEVIRTMRIPGVMTSDFLLRVFEAENDTLLYNELLGHKSLRFFNNENIKNEITDIFEIIIDYKGKQDKNLSVNQQFYIYLYEEVFRKYFGPELVIQNHYSLFNRTPFLDFDFIRELLKTKLAGVNGRYVESNPFLRFKGQILYSYILKKLKSQLSNYPTDRGYRPKDFFSFNGKLNIVKNYINNNYVSKKDKSFTEYNDLCFELNKNYFGALDISCDMFRKDMLQFDNLRLSDTLSHLLSLIIYFNKFL